MLIADFVVSTPEERDEEIARALTTAIRKADVDGKLGVFVTRHDFSRYSVTLSPAVPFGSILEHDLAKRHAEPNFTV